MTINKTKSAKKYYFIFIRYMRESTKKAGKLPANFCLLVPGTGIEPVRYRYRRILSPVRLPVPPPGHQFGHSPEIRTPDPLIKSQVLYRLS